MTIITAGKLTDPLAVVGLRQHEFAKPLRLQVGLDQAAQVDLHHRHVALAHQLGLGFYTQVVDRLRL